MSWNMLPRMFMGLQTGSMDCGLDMGPAGLHLRHIHIYRCICICIHLCIRKFSYIYIHTSNESGSRSRTTKPMPTRALKRQKERTNSGAPIASPSLLGMAKLRKPRSLVFWQVPYRIFSIVFSLQKLQRYRKEDFDLRTPSPKNKATNNRGGGLMEHCRV